MSRLYKFLHLKDGANVKDPFLSGQTGPRSVRIEAYSQDEKRRLVRRIERVDDTTMVVTDVASGRAIEFPWSSVREGHRDFAQEEREAAETKKPRERVDLPKKPPVPSPRAAVAAGAEDFDP